MIRIREPWAAIKWKGKPFVLALEIVRCITIIPMVIFIVPVFILAVICEKLTEWLKIVLDFFPVITAPIYEFVFEIPKDLVIEKFIKDDERKRREEIKAIWNDIPTGIKEKSHDNDTETI